MELFDDNSTPDWVCRNGSDGELFYGYNDGEGRTAWYDEDGNLDSCSDSPSDDDSSYNLYRYY